MARKSVLSNWGAVFAVACSTIFNLAAASRPDGVIKGEDLLQRAEQIFVGKLLKKESYLSDDKKFILTRHIFEVDSQLKGKSSRHIEITEYGGTVGDLTLIVSHNANYAEGSDYLVFTYEDELRQTRTLAGPVGQLPVLSDGQGNAAVRLYPAHPLAQALKLENKSVLQDLRSFSQSLSDAVEGMPHALR